MKKIYALTLASLLVAPAAVLADSHVKGNQGCNPHPDLIAEPFKNPGQMFRATRTGEAHKGANPKQAADLAEVETVGALIDAVCGAAPAPD